MWILLGYLAVFLTAGALALWMAHRDRQRERGVPVRPVVSDAAEFRRVLATVRRG